PALLDELDGEIIVTKNYRPQAVISPLSAGGDKRPALIVLGTKTVSEQKAVRTIRRINRTAEIFSKVIFVCSAETRHFVEEFKGKDLRVVNNEKLEYPIISPLKDGLGGLDPDDDYFVFTFLSSPEAAARLEKIPAAIDRARKESKTVVMLTIEGEPTHPIAIAASLQDEIIKTRKELGIPYLIRKYEADVFYSEI
ncbi:MAG: hypothetical protein ACLFN5_07530, partial [bacterium]